MFITKKEGRMECCRCKKNVGITHGNKMCDDCFNVCFPASSKYKSLPDCKGNRENCVNGELLEYCCNGLDCACQGKPQFAGDCPDCKKVEDIITSINDLY